MLPSAAGSSATVLVAFATIGVRPAAMSAGKVSSVPPPAIELTIPANSAAPAPTRSCAAGMEVEERLMTGSRARECREAEADAPGARGTISGLAHPMRLHGNAESRVIPIHFPLGRAR